MKTSTVPSTTTQSPVPNRRKLIDNAGPVVGRDVAGTTAPQAKQKPAPRASWAPHLAQNTRLSSLGHSPDRDLRRGDRVRQTRCPHGSHTPNNPHEPFAKGAATIHDPLVGKSGPWDPRTAGPIDREGPPLTRFRRRKGPNRAAQPGPRSVPSSSANERKSGHPAPLRGSGEHLSPSVATACV